MISSLFGGRIAEDIIYGADMVTTSASSSIEQATGLQDGYPMGTIEEMGPLLYAL